MWCAAFFESTALLFLMNPENAYFSYLRQIRFNWQETQKVIVHENLEFRWLLKPNTPNSFVASVNDYSAG